MIMRTRLRGDSRPTGFVPLIAAAAFCLGATGCKDILGRSALPSGYDSPSTYDTPSGAALLAQGTRTDLQDALPNYVVASGLLSDEIVIANPSNLTLVSIDSRRGDDPDQALYNQLQKLRGQAELARASFQAYAPDSSITRGEMYATEGYADVFLADLYCSGVPLSTIDFKKDFTYRAGSSTLETYRAAAALFDTAVGLSRGDVRVETLARVGWGRALIAVGLFDSAAHVAAPVSDSALVSYRVHFDDWNTGAGGAGYITTPAREGIYGLPYRSSGDPRTQTTMGTANPNIHLSVTLFVPTKYDSALVNDSVDVIVASGIEARLIEAEADLRAGGTRWVDILNHLRSLWSPTLPLLNDPGTTSARIDTLFRERAYWTLQTGHRQGDLRRLVRPTSAGGYGRAATQVYPVGGYPAGGAYGDAVSLRIPDSEKPNPKFTGCLNHE